MIELGTVIESVQWAGAHEIAVRFASRHTDRWHQLYIGRRLAGWTTFTADRVVRGQYQAGFTQPPLFVVAVDAANLSIDHGDKLPRRPWNLHRLNWTAAGMPADTDRFVVTAADSPGVAPSSSNRLGAVPYVAGRTGYSFDTPAIESCGDWQFGITPFDNRCGPNALHKGNEGTQAIATVNATVYPPDIEPQSDGHRFGIVTGGGEAAISFEYRSD